MATSRPFSWLPWNRVRRHRLAQTPLPDGWIALLERNLPIALDLSEADRRRWHGLIQVFLDDKTFEGLGGLELTDEVRLTIAGQATLLLLGLDIELPYPGLHVIRVYPDDYRAPVTERDGLFETEGLSHRYGESSGRGYVVLSWRETLRGARDPADGRNLVFHEFAHQLDAESGTANGAPLLHSRAAYGPWARVLGEAFSHLRRDVSEHQRSVLDAYGATNPAEFFAVATTTFFEQPVGLKAAAPELYAVLAEYWRQDPAVRLGRVSTT